MSAVVAIEVGYQDTKGADWDAVRWTERATGHRYWTFEIDVDHVVGIETVAEAVYMADNAPMELSPETLAGKIREAMIEAYRKTDDRHHSLSVGDRVRIGEVEVLCSSFGWERVYR